MAVRYSPGAWPGRARRSSHVCPGPLATSWPTNLTRHPMPGPAATGRPYAVLALLEALLLCRLYRQIRGRHQRLHQQVGIIPRSA